MDVMVKRAKKDVERLRDLEKIDKNHRMMSNVDKLSGSFRYYIYYLSSDTLYTVLFILSVTNVPS